MRDAGVIVGASIAHQRASVEEIERASRVDERAVVSELLSQEGVSEAFALQTCNRAEAYVVSDDGSRGQDALAAVLDPPCEDAVVQMDHEASLRHLMRVAAGLESLVLGEDQILGQLRTAFAEARAAGGIDRILEEALTKALHVGERARTETTINEGIVSIGRAAVELAGRELDLSSSTALVVGAGEMGRLAGRALADAKVAELLVANRNVERARTLADGVEVPAEGLRLDRLDSAATAADLVIAATGAPSYVLGEETLGDAGETVVVDIAQPRDVDPAAADHEAVAVRDIDDLRAITAETRANRREAAEAVEAMIAEEFDRLLESFKRKRADEAIGAMYESAERVKARELDTALSKLEATGELTDEQRETVESLADALVGQLLAAPTKSLREAAAQDDWTTIQTAMRLFDPAFEASTPDPDASPGTGSAGAPGRAVETIAEAEDVPQRILERLADD